MRRKTFTSELLESRLLLSSVSYDAAKNFSLSQNPNGVWSYGVRFTQTADYANFPVESTLDFGSGAAGWNENSGSPPYVGINTTGSEYDSEGIELPTGVLIMHPGGNGEYSDVRFTDPSDGPVQIKFQFAGIDVNGTTTDWHILYNNDLVKDGDINPTSGENSGPLVYSQAGLHAGDTIDFILGPGSNGTFDNDATSFEAQITAGVSGNHLVFSKQPTNGDLYGQEAVTVKLEDAKNQLVTNSTDSVAFELNNSSSDTDQFAYEQLTLPLKRGIAVLTAAQAPQITAAGTYTLTAADVDTADATVGTAASATSSPFDVSALHLVYTKQPANSGINKAVNFAVKVEDDRNKAVTPLAAIASVDVDTINQDTEAETSMQVPLVNGKLMSVEFPDAGTYHLEVIQAYAASATGAAINSAMFVESNPFTVTGYRFIFTRKLSTVGINAAVPFSLALVDYQNKPVYTVGVAEVIFVQLYTDGFNVASGSSLLTKGRFDNLKPPAGASSFLAPQAGPTQVQVILWNPVTDIEDQSVAPINSNVFDVVATT